MRRPLSVAVVIAAGAALLVWNAMLFKAYYHYHRSEALAASGDPQAALDEAVKAAKIVPSNAVFQRAVAQDEIKLGDKSGATLPLRRALEALERCIELDGRYPYYCYETALVLRRLQRAGEGQSGDPLAFHRRALEIDPTNPLFLSGMLSYLIGKGDRDEIRNCFARLVYSYPEAVEIYGPFVLRTQDDRYWFGKLIGSDARLNIEYAFYLVKAGLPHAAARRIELIPERVRTDPTMVFGVWQVLTETGNRDEAKRVLEVAWTRAEPGFRYYIDLQLAVYYYHVDDAKAISMYQRALREAPEHWEPYMYIGRVASFAGDTELAVSSWRSVINSGKAPAGTVADMYCKIGKAMEKSGDRSEALMNYRNALTVDPSSKPARAAIKRLELENAPGRR